MRCYILVWKEQSGIDTETEAAGKMGRTNLVLIGMPASGKSTVGVILAKAAGYDFIDTDLLIQQQEKARLAEIIQKEGYHCRCGCLMHVGARDTLISCLSQ